MILSHEDELEIIHLRWVGVSPSIIATVYGVSRQTITRLTRGDKNIALPQTQRTTNVKFDRLRLITAIDKLSESLALTVHSGSPQEAHHP